MIRFNLMVMESTTLEGIAGNVIEWKHFPCYWPFGRGNLPVTDGFPWKGPITRALIFPLMLAQTNRWTNSPVSGDLRRSLWRQCIEIWWSYAVYHLRAELFWHVNRISNFYTFPQWDNTDTWDTSWWRHQMETFSALLAICAGNSPVTGEFPAQRPVPRIFDVFFDLRLNKRLSKQPCGWWFETPSRSLWRHHNAYIVNTRPTDDIETHG